MPIIRVSSSLVAFLVAISHCRHTSSFSATTAAPPLPSIPTVLDIPSPGDLPPSVASDLESNGIAVVPNYACNDTINLLRFDALRLQQDGHSHTAGTTGEKNKAKAGRALRECDHFWLINPVGASKEKENDRNVRKLGRPPNRCRRRERPRYVGPPYVGELCSTLEEALDGTSPYSDDADYLAKYQEVEEEENPVHIHETEAAYLYYSKGGFYKWHMDTPSHEGTVRTDGTIGEEDRKAQIHRRAFSFLLYLGGDSSREKWTKNDGGMLRVYPRLSSGDQRMRVNGKVDEQPIKQQSSSSKTRLLAEPAKNADYTDILPHEGTLVIFKSEAICHEVLPTNRERLALVGWIHGDLM